MVNMTGKIDPLFVFVSVCLSQSALCLGRFVVLRSLREYPWAGKCFWRSTFKRWNCLKCKVFKCHENFIPKGDLVHTKIILIASINDREIRGSLEWCNNNRTKVKTKEKETERVPVCIPRAIRPSQNPPRKRKRKKKRKKAQCLTHQFCANGNRLRHV